MTKRDTLGLAGSYGFGPDLFVERELTGKGWRTAITITASKRIVEEGLHGLDVSAADVEFRRLCHKAVDAMFDGGVR